MKPKYTLFSPELNPARDGRLVAGAILIFIGIVVLLDQYLHTGWLIYLIIPMIGLAFLVNGIRMRHAGLIIAGSILTGLGVASFVWLSTTLHATRENLFGLALLALALGFGLITVLTLVLTLRTAWWALIPAGVIGGLGSAFLFSPLDWPDLVVYLATGLGLAFLIWGLGARLFGLIIPGSLLVTLGPAIYMAWGKPAEATPLAQVGVLLVTFALGWALITVFSRYITGKFIWWPLIPGGVLAVIGWGLYISGNPENAVSFISNTGSIGLIIFGVYLLAWRRSIHR